MAADEIADAPGPGRGERRKRGEPTRTVAIAPRWRLRRMDRLNWSLQELRDTGWRDTGNFFQSLLTAAEHVLEIELREGERDQSLADAVSEMKSIKESLCERIGNASLES